MTTHSLSTLRVKYCPFCGSGKVIERSAAPFTSSGAALKVPRWEWLRWLQCGDCAEEFVVTEHEVKP